MFSPIAVIISLTSLFLMLKGVADWMDLGAVLSEFLGFQGCAGRGPLEGMGRILVEE